jgi:exopolysaccharide biosynthesis polyprenyl glycosylphosphotransferase
MTSTLDQLAPGFTAKLNLITDLLIILAAMLAAGFGHYEIIVLSGVAMWLMLGITLRHYDAWAYGRTAAFDAGMVSIMMMAVMTLLIVLVRLMPSSPALADVAVVPLACWPLMVALRLLVFRTISRQEAPLDEVLIIGSGPLGRKTAEDIRSLGKRTVLGHLRFLDEKAEAELARIGLRNGEGPSRRHTVLGAAADLEKILRGTPVDEVMIAGQPLKQGPEMQACIRVCERFGVPFALPLSGFRFDRARPVGGRAVSDGYLHYLSVDLKRHQRAIKRLFDIVAAATALVVLSPLLVVVVAIIKLTSRGPVFFKQARCGLHGRPFQMLKFRSMVVDAEQIREALQARNEMSGPVFKIKNDPRITPIGRFIRKYSIDELPQLINVLNGDMSVVGPRPALPAEVARYESWQRRRLSVRPGLTCIWQVSGRNQISFEEWMVLDMQYIDRWSLTSDLSLILKTFPVVLTGRGAS